MKNKFDITVYRYIGISIMAVMSVCAVAQQDSALNRSVTVERDFQPVIQAAGKVSTKPAVVETEIEPAKVEYSEFSADVQPSATFHPLLSQPTRFEASKPFNGYVRGAFGHPNTLFDFGYHLDDGKKSILDVYAHHKAEWGLAALSKTKIGLDFTHPFSTCDLYFGINGGNIYYHKYAHFYDYAAFTKSNREFGMWAKNDEAYANRTALTDRDKTALWTAEAYIGVRSNPKQEIQYQVQTGYAIFAKPQAVAEHQLRTTGAFRWQADEHRVGAKVYVQNNFLQLSGNLAAIPDSLYRSRHSFRIEPYYEYVGRRVRVHAGVNLDLNLGHGQFLSGADHVSFAPSPHINLEAQIAKQWLTIYADIEGHHGLGSLQEYMEENRYRIIHAGIIEPHPAEYTPVDAEVGFHIRPYRDLLIEIHGGYAYMMHQDVWVAMTDTAIFAPLNLQMMQGDFGYLHTDYQRGKIGGQINYHLQDIVRINLSGEYYFWSGKMPVYDRPNWELNVRVDGRIDKHWSVYSDNYFAGNRLALSYDGTSYTDHHLKPTIELNAGVEYNMWIRTGGSKTVGTMLKPEPKPDLTLFLQLNNWLHRKNDIYYGYRSQGINFLLGATFRF